MKQAYWNPQIELIQFEKVQIACQVRAPYLEANPVKIFTPYDKFINKITCKVNVVNMDKDKSYGSAVAKCVIANLMREKQSEQARSRLCHYFVTNELVQDQMKHLYNTNVC